LWAESGKVSFEITLTAVNRRANYSVALLTLKLERSAVHCGSVKLIWSGAWNLQDIGAYFITGLHTHSVWGQTSNGRWHLFVVIVVFIV